MIDAVTYGMIPSAKRANRERAEPEKRLSRLRAPVLPLPLVKNCWSWAWSTPGAGMIEPRRYTARTPAVKRTRRRSSGTRQAFASHANMR